MPIKQKIEKGTKGLTRLSDLEVNEVSLVPRGANKRKFLVTKSAEESMPPKKHGEDLTHGDKSPKLSKQSLHDMIKKTNPEVMEKVDHLMKKHYPESVHKDPEPKSLPTPAPAMAAAPQESEGAEGLSEEAKAAVKAVARILTPFKGKLSPLMLHEVLDDVGFQLESGEAADEEGEEELEKAHKPLHDESEDEEDKEDAEEEGEELEKSHDEQDVDGLDEEVEKEHESEAGASHLGDGTQHGIAGEKEAHFEATPAKIESEENDPLGKVSKEHMSKAYKAAHDAYHSEMKKLGYKKYPDAQVQMKSHSVNKTKGEPVAKSANVASLAGLDPKTRKVLEPIFKAHNELVEQNDRFKAQLELRDRAEKKREIVQKAATFKYVALPKEEIVAALEDASRLGKASYERITKSFETLNEQSKASRLFGEIGSSLPGSQATDGSADAEAKLEKLADGLVAKSGEKMSKAESMDLVLKTPEGRRLYAQYTANRQGGI